jgi:integrase
VVDVDRQHVSALHHRLREKPYVANRTLAVVSKMMNLAERWGLRPDGTNPCRHVEKFKEAARERYLTVEEFSRLTQALAEGEASGTEGLHAIAAIRLLILTGCRMREILHLRWEHVDFDNGRLHLPDSKTGAKTVFLSAVAQQVLRQVPRTRSNPWVIEGRLPQSHLTDLKGPWKRICARADLKDVRIHDLRHSFAAVGAGLGLSLPMIGKLLGHSQAQTTARYAHLAADPVHEAADRIGERLAGLLGGAP